MKAHYWFILFLWVAVRMEAGGKMAVSPSATEMLLPFPSHDVELASSWVKQREDLNTAFLKSLEPDRLLHNFRVNAGLPSVAKPLEGWESPGVGLRGHFVGHYLSAVSALVERYEDAGLARNLEKVVEGMYACQQAHGNGYSPSATEMLLPFPSHDVELASSWVKQREDLNTAFLKSLEPDRLLHNFRVNAGLPSVAKPLEGWESPGVGLRGHFVGHYLSAVSALVERYEDAGLARNLEKVVEGMYACQQAHGNGYLSAFPETDIEVLETRFTGVWAPYYTLHKIMQGLLDVYLRTGNEKAYAMVEGLAGYVDRRMSKLDPATVARMMYTADANPQNEMGGMNEVLYQLYCVSGKPRYLELASLFDPSWFLEPLVRNEDILSGLHANTHIVLVNGFARRYESTGEECYRKSVANFWNMLMHSHAYVNGTSSGPRPNVTTETSLTAEHWGEPCHLCNTLTKGIAESCVTHNTQRLNASLFSWTGNPCYADVYMNMFYNAVLPVQSRSTGAYVYHLPLGSPRHKAYMADNDFKCCSGSCAEAFAKLNNGIYYHDDSAVYVNLYVPSKVHWADKKVGLEQAGGFPVEPIVDFTVSVRRPVDFVLNLFIPAWTDGAVVYVNGEKQEMSVRPSSFLKLSRRWADGDRVRIEFRYAFRLQSMPDKENMLAVFYGPMLLAFETRDEVILKGNKDEILAGLSFADSESGRFVLKNGEREFRLRPLFDVDKESYGVYATIRNY